MEALKRANIENQLIGKTVQGEYETRRCCRNKIYDAISGLKGVVLNSVAATIVPGMPSLKLVNVTFLAVVHLKV